MANARIFPGADRSRWFGDLFDGRIFTDLDKVLLHSTETPKNGGCPAYDGGKKGPTLTVNPWPGYRKVWQHFDLNESARALMNPTATDVSENKDNVCQIEIIGYSDKGYGVPRGCYLPDLDAESRQWLAQVLAFIMREWTVPNVWASPFPWPLYPSSYGNTSSRMTSAEYDAFSGVLGHLHASGNTHGDPSLPVADLRTRVGALLGANPTAPQEDEMTPAQEAAIMAELTYIRAQVKFVAQQNIDNAAAERARDAEFQTAVADGFAKAGVDPGLVKQVFEDALAGLTANLTIEPKAAQA